MQTATANLSNPVGVSCALRRAWAFAKPPPDLKPSEWAEQTCRIPSGNAIPGPVRFRNAPYQREPLDMGANPDCHHITLMWGAQTGKTQVQLMSMGYNIDQSPQSQMMMQPSQGDLQTWLNAKFDPMCDSTPSLSAKLAKPRGRDGVNNQQMKQYPGGFLMFAWSGSPKTMRGRSAPKIYCDETDGYDKTGEGHPVSLLWQRAATFGDLRQLFETSTPTIKGESHIEESFEAGDQRRFHVPCPHCAEKQVLKWGQVQWDKDDNDNHQPETAYYACEHCGAAWDDADRIHAIREGEWIAAKPFRGHASYHLNEMYSVFRRLRDIVQSFIEKKAAHDLQTFVNVSLAETWEEAGEAVDSHAIAQRREPYQKPPAEVLCVTAGVDVQDDRIEVELVGWGAAFESWGISYEVFYGDPGGTVLWSQLDRYLQTHVEREDGVRLPVAASCVDSGGHYTQTVYDFVRNKIGRRVFAIKGVAGAGRPIVSRATKTNKGKVPLYPVGVDTAKELLLLSRLRIAQVGPGYCHFPQHYDDEYFEQLTAERQVTRYHKGFPIREWKKTRPRNEALDMRVYAMAAVEILNPNFERLAAKLMPSEPQEPAPTSPMDSMAPKPKPKTKTRTRTARKRKGGGFAKSY